MRRKLQSNVMTRRRVMLKRVQKRIQDRQRAYYTLYGDEA